MPDTNSKQCPQCGIDLPLHLKACVGCGIKIDELKECNACEGYLGPDWLAFCGWCASPISTNPQNVIHSPDDGGNHPSLLSHLERGEVPFTPEHQHGESHREPQHRVSKGGSSISELGYDPEDMLEYLKTELSKQKQPDQAARLVNILNARWQKGETLETVAVEYDLTRERVRQLEKKAIIWLSELFATVGTQDINHRLDWIESHTVKAVVSRGGYIAVGEVEGDLECPDGALRFWFFFNSAFGLLNEKPKNLRTTLQLGRVTLENDFLSTSDGFKPGGDAKRLAGVIRNIVGSRRVMRLGDVLTALDYRLGQNNDVTSNLLARGTALETRGCLVLLSSPEAIPIDRDIWVSVGLSKAAREIARAILYGPIKADGISITHSMDHLSKGVRSDLISEWLDLNSDHKSSTRAIEALCKRTPKVFAMTDATSIGLTGAGAQDFQFEPSVMADIVTVVRTLRETQTIVSMADVTKELSGRWSGAWVNQTVILGIDKGYLTNNYKDVESPDNRGKYALGTGTAIPESEKWRNRKPKPQEHGQLIKSVITVLKDEPDGISEEDVLRRVRNSTPDASADSVSVYLNHVLNDLITVSPDKLYRLKEESIRELTDNPKETLERYTETSLRNLTQAHSDRVNRSE